MKLSEIEHLKKLTREHPELIADEEVFKLFVKEHGLKLEDAYQELEMDDAFVNIHEDPGPPIKPAKLVARPSPRSVLWRPGSSM